MMDLIGYMRFLCAILCWLTHASASGHIDRDIILSPNQTLQHIGKVIYFQPTGTGQLLPTTNNPAKFEQATSRSAAISINATKANRSDDQQQTIWEEPLKHAIYLVLNNKVDGNRPNTSDTVDKDLVYAAEYRRIGAVDITPKFGDIISLARGRLERNADNGRYVLIETDHGRHCGTGNCTLSSVDGTPSNVTALWQVEKIRHRNPSRGHAMELKLTIVPMRRNHAESKREIGSGVNGLLKARSFVVRNTDYPHYFDVGAQPPANKIQKRTFDMFAGLSQPLFDNYRIPLRYNYHELQYTDDLNTGEYYVAGTDTGATADHGTTARAFYQNAVPTIQFEPTSSGFHEQQLHRPNSIRFPTGSGSGGGGGGGGSTKNLGTAAPFTATHLHHHFYLNKNNVPLVKATGFVKENLIEHSNGPVQTIVHQSEPILQQNFSFMNAFEEPLSTADYPPLPSLYSNKYPSDTGNRVPHETHQSYQTPFAHSDPVAVSPPSLYEHHQQFPAYVHQPHLQVASPPHQQYYQPQQDLSLTTAQYGSVLPVQQHQLFAPIPIQHQHPIANDVPVQFQGNFKYEDDRFSDPDPIYHQQITTVTQHFNPHILPHLLPAFADPHRLFGQRLNINYAQTDGEAHPNEVSPRGKNPNASQPKPGQPMQAPPPPAEEDATGKDNEGADAQPESATEQNETINVPNVDVTEQIDSQPTGKDAGEAEPSDDSTTEPINVTLDSSTESRTDEPRPPNDSPVDQPQTTDYATMEHIDPNSSEGPPSNVPDSINAQLPPPEQGEDLTVPYVDSSSVVPKINEQPEKFQIFVPSDSNHRTPLKPYKPKASSTVLQPVHVPADKLKLTRQRGSYMQTKTTTEKPILKWMPKRSKPTRSRPEDVISTILTASTTVQPNVVIVTPSHDGVEEPRTSISTSISFSSSADKSKRQKSAARYTGFLPTILPSNVVSLKQGNVTTIKTNSTDLRLFRASDEDDDANNGGIDQQIARSIIKHAQNL